MKNKRDCLCINSFTYLHVLYVYDFFNYYRYNKNINYWLLQSITKLLRRDNECQDLRDYDRHVISKL